MPILDHRLTVLIHSPDSKEMLKVLQGGTRFMSRGQNHGNGLRCEVAQEIVEGSSDNVIEEFGHFIPFVVGVQAIMDIYGVRALARSLNACSGSWTCQSCGLIDAGSVSRCADA